MDIREFAETIHRWRADTTRQYRLMTFGASESHFGPHTGARPNWFYWLERALRLDAVHLALINTSQGGNCVRDLCGRFKRDCAPLKADAVFIAMGGNDANVPVPLPEFREKLTALCREIKAWGGIPVLHTVYQPILAHFSPYYQENFDTYMQINREVAAAEDIPCLDMNRWFRPYYLADPERYAALMADDIHVNEIGNGVWAYFVCEELGLPQPDFGDLADAIHKEVAVMRRWAEEQ